MLGISFHHGCLTVVPALALGHLYLASAIAAGCRQLLLRRRGQAASHVHLHLAPRSSATTTKKKGVTRRRSVQSISHIQVYHTYLLLLLQLLFPARWSPAPHCRSCKQGKLRHLSARL